MKAKILFIIIIFTSFCVAQNVTIPDANFNSKLLQADAVNLQIAKNLTGDYFKIDANNDGSIQNSEALNVSFLNVSYSNISSISGIESFINLNTLNCSNNQLSNVNVQNLINLQGLYCASNQITTLNVQGLTNLTNLNCSYNQITTLNIQNLPNISIVYCAFNSINSLNIQGIASLTYLDCQVNQLPNLNLQGLTNLTTLWCHYNQLTTLNIQDCINLNQLLCHNNLLISLFLKNGKIESSLTFQNNPNLQYICADENQITQIQNIITNNNSLYTPINCNLNSYCSFTPGGTFFTIQGNQKYDFNNNGCDSNDIICPKLKYSITNGTNTSHFISNNTGSYNIPVQAGTHTITPIIENPTYFNVAPNTFTVNFPVATSPYIQDFCVTSNGNHNDLELMLIPINEARPGFDANYKLVYKNNGTDSQSGTLNFSFDDSVLDFVSSNVTFTSQSTGNLIWNFTNLVPFESREINITLNLNSPIETPALNSGDILNYTASINGQTDETPDDNSTNLIQIVVNSYDPNDKTCMEGTTILPSMVGDYVHYLIRFENNGTANAQNIVIKDIIDMSKFDINTLIPMYGSHNFETRISNINKVEFIFQNINLPFDDANNDGYVSFKIKTKSNLVTGDTFSNLADIYFDYNFPIVTNNYATTIQNTLGVQENELKSDISVYPNPVKDVLNFKTEHTILKIEVYDSAGRILSSKSISENKIDLSELKTGNYILKLYTEKGITNIKITKE